MADEEDLSRGDDLDEKMKAFNVASILIRRAHPDYDDEQVEEEAWYVVGDAAEVRRMKADDPRLAETPAPETNPGEVE